MKKTILLIDDDYQRLVDLLSIAADEFDLSLIGVGTIENGLQKFREQQNDITAILLDLSFSPGNYEGVLCLEKIKSINPLIPVIILTGSDAGEDLDMAVNCMKNGAYNYMLKSHVHSDLLFEMLTMAITQYKNKSESKRRSMLIDEFNLRILAYKKMLQTTKMIVGDLLEGQMMFQPTIEIRVKEFNSFYNKLLNKEEKEGKISDPFKRLVDVVGMRAIFYNSKDLEKAISLIQESNDFLPIDGSGALIGDDKTSTYGYRAIHFDVKLNPEKRLHLREYTGIENIPCEIQFKTIFAHSWSKVHHALSYKQNGNAILSEPSQNKLDEDFRKAAKSLMKVEEQITSLCQMHHEATNKSATE